MFNCNLAKAPSFPLFTNSLITFNWPKIRRFFTPKPTFSTSGSRKGIVNASKCVGRQKQLKESANTAPLSAKSNVSSWVEAAESFRSQSGPVKDYDVEDGDEGNGDDVEDSRWIKIKEKIGHRDSNFRKSQVWRNRNNVGSEQFLRSRFMKPEWSRRDNSGGRTWKDSTESSVPKTVGQCVYGVGPVLAALVAKRREFYALYVQEGLDLGGNSKRKKDKKAVEKILHIADSSGLKVVETSKHDLNMIVENRPHQGLVLDATPLEMVTVRELDPPTEGRKSSLWLALDEVTDPQNLGAIIRSAYFFGAEGVVMCAKNSAPLSGVVSKASAGSLELIELLSCKNMMQFLSSCVDNGWRVLGGSVSASAVSLSEVKAGVPTILVLGSEGHGLRPLVERSCSQLIRIPGNIPENVYDASREVSSSENNQDISGKDVKSFIAVESLNVSVATGVLLYHLAGNNNQES